MSVIDARECSVRRLQRLQALCAEPGDAAEGAFTSLLLVAGADGRDNWGSNATLRWLLGESGAALLDGLPRPFHVPRDVAAGARGRRAGAGAGGGRRCFVEAGAGAGVVGGT